MLWKYQTPGIPDELFERTENVPITKEDVRSIIISKLRLKEGFNAIDVGCGSGSITVELANLSKNIVYAIDLDKNAIELTNRNLSKFGLLDKVKVMYGSAQELLPTLENADAIVIGGTTGETERIIGIASKKLKKGGRLVVTTILIETIYKSLKSLESLGLNEIDITQVTVAKSKKTSSGTMMISRNPVIIFSATK